MYTQSCYSKIVRSKNIYTTILFHQKKKKNNIKMVQLYEYILIFNIYTYFYGWGKFCILRTRGRTTVVYCLIIILCSWKSLSILVLNILLLVQRELIGTQNLKAINLIFNIQQNSSRYILFRHLNYPRWPSDETAATAASP